jgi:ribonuclease P protein component
LPKENRLRKPKEFKEVYNTGKRFDGRFMTVFIKLSVVERHRLGITASKKAIGNAVERNRTKRLLRETFRLSKAEIFDLTSSYDWVLNAKRSLLMVKLEKPLNEFRTIAAKVKVFEQSKGVESSVNKSK